jgi:hypothetical protein
VTDSVLDAARRRSAALVDKDVDALLALLHPDFLYVNANGEALNRDEYLDRYVRPAEMRWISQDIREPRVTVAGTTAVLTCLVHDVAEYLEHRLDQTFRTTLTWVDVGDGWQCLSGHTSTVQ